jgi:hypothetical protein
MNNLPASEPSRNQRIGIAADHGGFELKRYLSGMLRADGHLVVDFGDDTLSPDDDYPDFVVPLAQPSRAAQSIAASPSAAAELERASPPTRSGASARA